MRTARQRAADIKLLVGATVGVLLAGGLIAVGLLVATDEGGPGCGRTLAGEAGELLDRLEAGPSFLSGGGRCNVWLALDDGEVVAYRVRQPDGCTLDLRRNEFECDGRPVDTADLARYPVTIETKSGLDTYVVDLGAEPADTTPTT